MKRFCFVLFFASCKVLLAAGSGNAWPLCSIHLVIDGYVYRIT